MLSPRMFYIASFVIGFIALIPLLISIYISDTWLTRYNLAQDSLNWTPVEATIISKGRSASTESMQVLSSLQYYSDNVQYKFSYKGEGYQGQQLSYDNGWATINTNNEGKLLKSLPKTGEKTKIYFDPATGSPNRNTIPLNHWTNNGENKLLVSVNFKGKTPIDFIKSSSLRVALHLRVKNQDTEMSHLITEFDLNPSDDKPNEVASSSLQNIRYNSTTFNKSENGDIVVGSWQTTPKNDWIRFEQTANIDLGLPTWSYLSADYLGDEAKMTDDEFYGLSDELYLEYKKIWELMKNKDSDALLALTNTRSDEMNKAFYLPSDSKQSDMIKSFLSALDNEDLQLFDLIDNERTQLSILANGKIANIKVAETDVPPILFTHIRDSFTRSYDFYFMKKSGKWIIIR